MPRQRRKSARLASACLSVVLLTGCASNGVGIVDASVLCESNPEIKISKNDKLTDGTAVQIEKHNVGRKAICGE